MSRIALAIAAHPDDIEFLMAGTLLHLRGAGYETHYMNLSTGNCGSTVYDPETTAAIRLQEARRAAEILGARFHDPICNDFEIMYNVPMLAEVAAAIRRIRPNVILTHSPTDYMEDHMSTSRLVTTAAFIRGVKNYDPGVPAAGNYDCALYHAVPHGLKGPLGEEILPDIFINTGSVHGRKLEALKAHQSQQEWLEDSQKMNSYLLSMEEFSLTLGRLSGGFEHAEGWRQHFHLGFSAPGYDPLAALGDNYQKRNH